MSRLHSKTIAIDDEETGFMENKSIPNAWEKRRSPSRLGHRPEEEADFEEDAEEELSYFKSSSVPPRPASRRLKAEATERNFTPEKGLRPLRRAENVRDADTVTELLRESPYHPFGSPTLEEHVSSLNPPGTDKRIQDFLDSLKSQRSRRPPRNSSLESDVSLREIARKWPSDIKEKLDALEKDLRNKQVEECVDRICALLGIAAENQVGSAHRLFQCYLQATETG